MKEDIANISHNHPMLKAILLDVESHYGVEFTKTSGWRPGDKGVHGTKPLLRGTDLRCPDRKFGRLVEKRTNSKYQYDPDRPKKKVCWHHKSKGGAWHLHFQVHPNTIVINQ